jgi:hypothetical protein
MNRHDKSWASFRPQEPIFINIDAVMDALVLAFAVLVLGAIL